MQIWLNFLMLIFWLVLVGYLYSPLNFIILLFFSEITWVVLYSMSICIGLLNDDITALTLSFFILGIAGIEFSIGFLILILFKNFNLSFSLLGNNKITNQWLFNNTQFFYDKVLWYK